MAALGWGVSGDSDELSENLILVENLLFISTDSCNEENNWRGIVKENMLCAGYGQDSCRGAIERNSLSRDVLQVTLEDRCLLRTFPMEM